MDLVAGDNNWDVILDEHNGSILAAFPFVKKNKAWFKVIGMPDLTPYMGIWWDTDGVKTEAERKTLEKRIQTSLIERLPPRDKFFIQLFPEISNGINLDWNGYETMAQHTYIIDNLADLNGVYNNFRRNIKGDITKAKKSIQIITSNDFDNFYQTCSKTFVRIKKKNPYDKELMRKAYETAHKKGCGRLMVAKDENGNTHAAVLLVWDKKTTYYLAGGGDPHLRSSGATSLLLWEAIQWASTVTSRFDFEGSMIPSVEKFFQGFGARQTPYLLITQTSSYILRLRESIKKALS